MPIDMEEGLSDGQHASEKYRDGAEALRLHPAVLRGGSGCGHRAGFRRVLLPAGIFPGAFYPCQYPDDGLQRPRGKISRRSRSDPRIVTARELSLEEIRLLHEGCGCEIETFVHGALCVCYSGQCLMSSLIGGRSGNREEVRAALASALPGAG